ncbi:MAG: acyltransferase [Bacteroidetes bacterium]|nr:acyltransferase [Bacteroidota bacterium]
MTNSKNYQELQSKVIAFIRFPLIVGVVISHNIVSEIVINGEIIGTNNDLPIYTFFSRFFDVGGIAIALFFLMSGFLFFLNVEKFDISVYESKLKNRAKTLLVPYLFWNLAVFTLYMIMNIIPQLNGFLNKDINFSEFFSYFWNNDGAQKEGYAMGMGRSSRPIAYQFWFIRDLMIAVVLTPIVYFFCRTTKIYGVILLGVLWYLGCWSKIIGGHSGYCIFFFTAGAYCGINKRNLVKDFSRVRNLSFILYPLIAFAKGYDFYDFNAYIHKADTIIGSVFWFNLLALLFEKRKIKPIPFLGAASFFVFAIHEPFLLRTLRKITFMILKPESDFALTSLYFMNTIFVVLTALGVYYVLNRFFPKFTAIISGGK